MADPLLQGQYPMRGLYQALAVAAMCLQEQASTRPLIGDVVTALTYLASQTYDPSIHLAHSNRFVGSGSTPGRDKREKERKSDDQIGNRASRRKSSPDTHLKEGGPIHISNGTIEDSSNMGSARRYHLDVWDKQEGSGGGSNSSPSSGGRTPRRSHRSVHG